MSSCNGAVHLMLVCVERHRHFFFHANSRHREKVPLACNGVSFGDGAVPFVYDRCVFRLSHSETFLDMRTLLLASVSTDDSFM